MDNDEYESSDEQGTEDRAERPNREPGPAQPETFEFRDWALI